jgi:hypothetical protein
MTLVNTTIVNSEFPQRGEMLAYYYFHKTHFADKAVIIHDSVFINSYIDFNKYEVCSLWSFKHYWDIDSEFTGLIKLLNMNGLALAQYYRKHEWLGCFGMMAVVTWEFVDKVNKTFNYFNALLPATLTRQDRMVHERIWACMIAIYYPKNTPHIISDIHQHGWGSTYNDYLSGKLNHLPIIKVWTGR